MIYLKTPRVVLNRFNGFGVGLGLNMNLVDIAAALGNIKPLKGRLNLIPGIKKTWLIDDSYNAAPQSTHAALDILDSFKAKRKIAVLGDILDIGKYALEAHEAIGEKVKGSADLLFTVGDRAKFFAEGARKKGMTNDRIFEFYEVGPAALALQDKIGSNDLILVDGSKEIHMTEVVKEIQAY